MDEEYEKIFKELSKKGVYGSALISREGMILYSDLPASVHEETFGIMVATMVGAGKTANSELDRSSPSKIIVDSKDGRIVTVSVGRNKIISVVVDSTYQLAPLFKYLNEVVEGLNS